MERLILQVKYENRNYNKFILIGKRKDKNGNIIYGKKELLANKDVSINYYNKLFTEGDFDNILEKENLQTIIDNMEKEHIIKYIKNNFKDFEKILK